MAAIPEKVAVVRLIAVFKLFKAAGMLVLAYGILKLLNPDFAAWLAGLAAQSPYPLEQHLIEHLLEYAAGSNAGHIHTLGAAALVYAGIFFTEGLGLWWDKHWAEWLTVVVTTSFIPVELWQLFTRPRITTLLVVIVNVAILVYFVRRLLARRKEKGLS